MPHLVHALSLGDVLTQVGDACLHVINAGRARGAFRSICSAEDWARGAPACDLVVTSQSELELAGSSETAVRLVTDGVKALVVLVPAGTKTVPSEFVGMEVPVLFVRSTEAGTKQFVKEFLRFDANRSDEPGRLEQALLERLNQTVDNFVSKYGGSLIVEDGLFQILAYSRIIGPIDEARRQAILERQLPARYRRIFAEQGVFKRLLDQEGVLRVAGDPQEGLGERLVAGVRYGGSVLGSIWYANDEGLTEEAEGQLLIDFGEKIAPVLKKFHEVRAGSQRLADIFLDAIFERSPLIRNPRIWSDLGIEGGASCHILLCRPQGSKKPTNSLPIRNIQRIVSRSIESLGMHAVTSVSSGDLRILLVGCRCVVENDFSETVEQIWKSAQREGVDWRMAAGAHGKSVHEAGVSAASAMAAMDVLELIPELGPTGHVQDLWAYLLVVSSGRAAREMLEVYPDVFRKISSLFADERLEPAKTLRALLVHDSIGAAAEWLHVHPNTLRYRVSRFEELLGASWSNGVLRACIALLVLSGHEGDSSLQQPRP